MAKAKAKPIETNLGPVEAPAVNVEVTINPAVDPARTAEERLASLTEQHAEQRARQERGESPD